MPIFEKEVQSFWRAARRVRLNVRNGGTLSDDLDDISLIAERTGNEILRARCNEMLGHEAEQASA
jgi:hypothetical protein